MRMVICMSEYIKAKTEEIGMALALTYDEVKALGPCPDRWVEVSRALGGKAGWNGKKIDAATARAAGITFDDLVWVASAVARADADVERRLRLWMADCAAHVLHIYERTESSTAPRKAIIAARAFARGEIDDAARAAARAAAWDAAWAAARDAAWAAAWDAEEAWQFDRLVAWLSLDEPDDYPLPDRVEVAA